MSKCPYCGGIGEKHKDDCVMLDTLEDKYIEYELEHTTYSDL